MDSIEENFRLGFAIRQINSALDQVSMWMSGQEPSMAEVDYVDRLKLGVNFFLDNPTHILLCGDYLNIVQAVDKLSRDYDGLIAAHGRGDTKVMRDEVRRVIAGLPDILDGIDYPGGTAARMRTLPDLE